MTAFNQFKKDFESQDINRNNPDETWTVTPYLTRRLKCDKFDGRTTNTMNHINDK